MARRAASCLLCGARLAPAQVLDACEEIADAELGVLVCHCPDCQGHFDVRPVEGCVEIGYLRNGRFDVVVPLPADGLTALREMNSGALRVRLDGRAWAFAE
ncbi:MAG: hypothetical protein AB1642_02090 [Pseudomonadota bacterium]